MNPSPASTPATLILSRRDVAALMAPADYLDAVEQGFRALAEGRAHAPPPMAIEGEQGNFHAKGASIELDRRYVALKLNGNFPRNPATNGLPTIQGAVLLSDGSTGALLAIIDSIEVTLGRTAAASALAARYLARPDSGTILICGCGEQAVAQLAALRAVLPLTRGFAWDCRPARAHGFAATQSGPGFAVAPVSDLPSAARQSDVIVTCTTAQHPFLMLEMVAPGAFIAAVGADSPHKCEISPALMAQSLVVADVLDQCVVMGDTRHAIASGMMRREHVHAELGDLVAGKRPGRTSADQIALFDSTGAAVQDVASAALIYRRAVAAGGSLAVQLGAPR